MKKLTIISFVLAFIALSTSACNSTPAKSDGAEAKPMPTKTDPLKY